MLGSPPRATQAASPLVFGLLMDRMGIGVLAISAGLSLSALVALLVLKARPAAAPVPAWPMALTRGTRGYTKAIVAALIWRKSESSPFREQRWHPMHPAEPKR
jgi:hypothetical protein